MNIFSPFPCHWPELRSWKSIEFAWFAKLSAIFWGIRSEQQHTCLWRSGDQTYCIRAFLGSVPLLVGGIPNQKWLRGNVWDLWALSSSSVVHRPGRVAWELKTVCSAFSLSLSSAIAQPYFAFIILLTSSAVLTLPNCIYITVAYSVLICHGTRMWKCNSSRMETDYCSSLQQCPPLITSAREDSIK